MKGILIFKPLSCLVYSRLLETQTLQVQNAYFRTLGSVISIIKSSKMRTVKSCSGASLYLKLASFQLL